jgi:predicted dehydrogenase
VQKHTTQKIHALASRTPGRAEAVAEKFGIELVLEDYESLVQHPEVDAIYVASHIKDHYLHALLAINAGKHVLVEKPIAYLPEHAAEIFKTAREKGVLAMEAMWTRYLPQSDSIRQVLESGELGQPELFTASFCVDGKVIPRLFQRGSGGIVYDMGIYPITMAQQFMGNPTKITAVGKVNDDGMDLESFVVLEYANGSRAQLSSSGVATLPISGACSFEKSVLVFDEPFFGPGGYAIRTKTFNFEQEHWRDETAVKGHEGLSYQATAFASYVSQGLLESPVHTHEDVVANIEVAHEICRQIGATPY